MGLAGALLTMGTPVTEGVAGVLGLAPGQADAAVLMLVRNDTPSADTFLHLLDGGCNCTYSAEMYKTAVQPRGLAP
jgi:hypothetical protein